jgi:O-antigen/teichoic acid export membrane protein
MYMDGITDGMLRGLGLQVYSMGVNIADSLVSVVMVWILLPKYGASGYIAMIFFTEVFNFILSGGKLWAALRALPDARGKRGVKRRAFAQNNSCET